MSTLENLRIAAKRLLKLLRANDVDARRRFERAHPNAPSNPTLRDVQHALATERGYDSWLSLRDGPRPHRERYASLARDVVSVHVSGDSEALKRLQDYFGPPFTVEQFLAGVTRRVSEIPASERPEGPFALAHAQLLIATEAGASSWNALVKELDAPQLNTKTEASRSGRPEIPDVTERMICPVEMRELLDVRLQGQSTTTHAVWEMLSACRLGNLGHTMTLVEECPALTLCSHNYMSPLHLAVREGHDDVVRFLIDKGAANPKYVTYPYRESLVTVASDRKFDKIVALLEAAYRTGDSTRNEDEGGETVFLFDETHRRFQKLLNSNNVSEVESILRDRPDLALNPLTFWGEGAIMMPAKLGNQSMIELLMRYGATVPDISKWGAWYYLWSYNIASFLLQHGMDANHMNCHHTTVLHDMAYKGDLKKAKLLLDHGADFNAIDEEFQSTPLGLAVRWGHRTTVQLLLEHGADPNASGAPWASPLAWAAKKGHHGLEKMLRDAGAIS